MLASSTVVDGKYEIKSTLAFGGFGVVYEARQLGFDRIVALKILQSGSEDDQEEFHRFEREARILSSLRHRNLVMFYGFGSFQSSFYYAMEMVIGESLDALLSRRGPLQWREAVTIVKQICEALNCAHSHGVVHRDLKPMNIMLCDTTEGTLVKLIDFGLAKLVTSDITRVQKLTQAGSTVGSVEYMSPEQCLGRSATAASDVYATACVLQRCLTGKPPFTGDNSVAVMHMHVDNSPPPLPPTVGAPSDMQYILNKALAKEPDARYKNVGELLHDLEVIESDSGEALIGFGAPLPAPLSGNKQAPPSLTTGAFILTAACLALALGTAMFQYLDLALHPRPRDSSAHSWAEAKKLDAQPASPAPIRLAALDAYLHALDLNKRDRLLDNNQIADIYWKLAQLYSAGEQPLLAKHYASECISLRLMNDDFDHDMPNVCQILYDACQKTKKEAMCSVTLEKVVDAWPNNHSDRSMVKRLLAQTYIDTGRYDEAIVLLEELKASDSVGGEERKTVMRELSRAVAAKAAEEGTNR